MLVVLDVDALESLFPKRTLLERHARQDRTLENPDQTRVLARAIRGDLWNGWFTAAPRVEDARRHENRTSGTAIVFGREVLGRQARPSQIQLIQRLG